MDNNRLELVLSVIDENTANVTAKARTNMRNFVEEAVKAAQGATNSLDKMTVELARTLEKASQSGISSLERLEARAARVGKSGVQRLVMDRDQLIKSLGVDEPAIQRVMAAYNKLIKARQDYEHRMNNGGHGGSVGTMVARRGFLALKDAGEGRTSGVFAEVADIMFGQGGSGGVVQKVIPQIAEITGLSNTAVIAVGSLAAAFVGLEVAGFKASEALAEQGREIRNFSARTGIAPTRVQAFQFAAEASGANPDIFERMTKGLAQAANEESPAGNRARKEIKDLGVKLYDDVGDLKPTEQIILELADGINKLPPGLKQSAASMEIFKRIGADAVPVLKDLRENLKTSDEVGGTFTEADLEMFEKWHKELAVLHLEWTRFKTEVEIPLAVTFKYTLNAASTTAGLFAAVGELARQNVSGLFLGDGSSPDKPKPPSAEQAFKTVDRVNADALIRTIKTRQEQDPAFRLREVEKQITELGPIELGVTPLPKVQEYDRLTRQKDHLQAAKEGNKSLEGIVAARKERLQLESQYAEIQQSSQQKLLSASINSSRELSSPDDIAKQLQLAEVRVSAEQRKVLNDRRYKVDEKTGTIRDLSGTADYQKFAQEESANLPLRLRNEYAKVLGDLEAQDARYFRARTDADAKAWDEAWHRRQKGELDLQEEEIRTRQQIQSHQFDIDGQSIDRQREMALQSLDGVNAQTLKEKIALEDQKLAIEQAYADRSLANQIAKIQNEQALAVGEIQKKAAADGIDINSDSVQGDIAAARDKYQQQIDAARAATGDRESLDAQKAQSAKERLQIESNKRVYDSLKHDAEGLFDQLVYHTQTWGDFFKGIFKSAVLTPVKEIFSSQVGALETKALTGQDVSFGEVGNGQGWFGRLGSIFGRAGLGQPRFGSNQPVHKLEQPNHLGDVSLVSGAVPVVLMNAGGGQGSPQQQIARSGGGFSFGSLAAGLGLGGLFAGGLAATPPFLPSAIAPSVGGTANSYAFLDGIIDATSVPGSFLSGANQLVNIAGGTGDLSKSLFTQALSQSLGSSGTSGGGGIFSSILHTLGIGGGGNSGGGIFSKIGGLFGGSGSSGGGGILSKIGGLFGLGGSGGGAAGGKFDGFGGLSGLSPAGGGGIMGMLGGMGGMLGLPLMLGGLMKGGTSGGIMGIGGGALTGLMVAGPWGAIGGAAIGGARLLAEKLGWITTDRKHAKDLVKQVYGMDINNATADQIVAIAKQSYGGQIDVAVRSQQVRDLLKLYAQTTGQKSAEDKFVQDKIHSASLTEADGKLFQNAVYDNGNAYSYSSPLSVYGGTQTSPLSTYAPNQGYFGPSTIQLNVNGQSAAALLDGRVATVATPQFVSSRALAASSSSIGRNQQTSNTIQPSAISR